MQLTAFLYNLMLLESQFVVENNTFFNIGIKHDFPFINIRKVPKEAFSISWGTLWVLVNDKIMFDRY